MDACQYRAHLQTVSHLPSQATSHFADEQPEVYGGSASHTAAAWHFHRHPHHHRSLRVHSVLGTKKGSLEGSQCQNHHHYLIDGGTAHVRVTYPGSVERQHEILNFPFASPPPAPFCSSTVLLGLWAARLLSTSPAEGPFPGMWVGKDNTLLSLLAMCVTPNSTQHRWGSKMEF